MGPTINIVIPCFNDGEYLREGLQQLLSALPSDCTLTVVDDGSSEPGTLAVLAEVEALGVHLLRLPHGGVSAARNAGAKAGTAPYILFLDADNRMDIGFLPACLRAFKDEGADVVFCDIQVFGQRHGTQQQQAPDAVAQLVGNGLDAFAAVRRTVFEAAGGYDEALQESYEDWDLWLRLVAAGAKFHRIARPLLHYHARPGSLSGSMRDPERRHKVVSALVTKHVERYRRHVVEVVAELHRIQATDQHALAQARELLAQAETKHTAAQHAHDALVQDQEEAASALRDTVAQRERSLQHAESELAQRSAQLATTVQERERLLQEAHKQVQELDAAMQALGVQREHGRALQALITQYEERIAAIEGSRWWRLRRSWYKLSALLRTGSSTSKRGFKWLRRVLFLVSGQGRRIVRRALAKLFRTLYLWTEVRPVRIVLGGEQQGAFTAGAALDPYARWCAAHDARPADLAAYREDAAAFVHTPLISVVMPVYEPPLALLDAAIRSVVRQCYPHWELCIADDNSPSPAVRETLRKWMADEPRIKVVFRTENGHISKASNSALELAQGEYVALMDHDDLLAPDALHHVAKTLQRDPATDMLYTDEDKIDEQGQRSEAHFKPQWCPDHLLSRNYFGHLVVLRTAIVREVGAFREGFEGSQDYDLLLRFTERTQRVVRIPRVLYHWRIHAGSAAHGEEVKPYAYDAARRALEEAATRRGEPAEVSFLPGFRGYATRFTGPLRGKVSVIIPTKDKADVLGTCLRSLFTLTDHPDYEVLVISNNSRERATFQLLEDMARQHPGRFRWVAHDQPFNFSALMNEGARLTTGEHILYLNNDTGIIHADWLRTMHAWSQRPGTGAVGVKLLYHNDTIQHAGVVIGLGGVAGHVFTGTHKDGPGYFNYVNTLNNYSALTAACLMVERRKLEAIGGWDEAFTVEYNDVDLCLRLRESGLHNLYLPQVSLYHYESLTRGHPHLTKESYERHLREVDLFKRTWAGYVKDDPCYNPHLTRGAHDWRLADQP